MEKIKQLEEQLLNAQKLIKDTQSKLEKLKNQPTKFEVGKWYIVKEKYNVEEWLFRFEKIENKNLYGFGVWFGDNSGWFNGNFSGIDKVINYRLATEDEVKKALIKEAEKRGYKVGTSFKTLDNQELKTQTINRLDFSICLKDNCLRVVSPESQWSNFGGCSNPAIFKDGVWAEIVKQEPLKVCGYKVKKDGKRYYKIGCKTIHIDQLKHISDFMNVNELKVVEFDSLGKIDIQTIEKILNLK